MVSWVSNEEQRRAAARAQITATGIGAAFEREIGPPDLDGTRWRVWLSNGTDAGPVEVELSKTQQTATGRISVMALQRACERRAGGFPRETRLREMLAEGRLRLRSDDFRDSDFEPADSWLAA